MFSQAHLLLPEDLDPVESVDSFLEMFELEAAKGEDVGGRKVSATHSKKFCGVVGGV